MEAAAGMAAPTSRGSAMEVVETLGAAEPRARGTGARGAAATPQAEGTGNTRAQALMELAAAAPRRTADTVTLDEVATFGAAEPPEREVVGASRGEVTEAAGRRLATTPMELARGKRSLLWQRLLLRPSFLAT